MRALEEVVSWEHPTDSCVISILALSYPLLPQKEPALLGSAANPKTRPTHIPLDWPRGQSQKFLEQCLGCWGPLSCLPPEPLASSRLVGNQQEGECPTFPLHSSALSRLGPLGKAIFWPPFQGWSSEGRSGARITARNTKKQKRKLLHPCA